MAQHELSAARIAEAVGVGRSTGFRYLHEAMEVAGNNRRELFFAPLVDQDSRAWAGRVDLTCLGFA